MPSYITVTGTVTFADEAKLQAATDILLQHKFIKDYEGDFVFVDEFRNPIHGEVSAVCKESLSIHFPCAEYCNMSRVLNTLLEFAAGGEVKWYSLDCGYTVRKWRDGNFTIVNNDAAIIKLAGLTEQIDMDVFAMDSVEWETKYDGYDFGSELISIMDKALNNI